MFHVKHSFSCDFLITYAIILAWCNKGNIVPLYTTLKSAKHKSNFYLQMFHVKH